MSAIPLSLGKNISTINSQEALLEQWFLLPNKERIKQFLDTNHAAQQMAVSQRTIRLWIEFGNIQAIRVGKKYHVHTSSLMEFISKRTQPP
jgi:excisionase family DNA binding protein